MDCMRLRVLHTPTWPTGLPPRGLDFAILSSPRETKHLCHIRIVAVLGRGKALEIIELDRGAAAAGDRCRDGVWGGLGDEHLHAPQLAGGRVKPVPVDGAVPGDTVLVRAQVPFQAGPHIVRSVE